MRRGTAVLLLLLSGMMQAQNATPIPASYFGMDIGKPANYPSVNFNNVRLWDDGVYWAQIETAQNVYNWKLLDAWIAAAHAHGQTDILYVFGHPPGWALKNPDVTSTGTGTDQHWKDFVTALVTRYKGVIKYYEGWNEWNIKTQYNGTLAQLKRMMADAYPIIHKIDPAAKLTTPSVVGITGVSGGMKKWLATGAGKYADIIAFHCYIHMLIPIEPENVVPMITGLKQVLVQYGQQNKPLWCSEGGWGHDDAAPNNSCAPAPSCIGYPDPTLQAGFVARMYLLQWGLGVSRFNWYQWDNTTHGTLWDTTTGIHPAGIAYQQVHDWLVGNNLSSCAHDANGTWTCNISNPTTGFNTMAVWNPTSNIDYPVASGFTTYRDPVGNLSLVPGGSVPITTNPILLAPTPAPITITVQTGDNQSAAVATQLAAPIVVKVTDGNGNGLSGASINFTESGASPAGSFSKTTVVTDAAGQASTSYTTSQKAGPATITASWSGIQATLTATALAGSVTTLTAVSPGGAPMPGDTITLVANASDQYGNPVPNAYVTFDDAGAGGTLSDNGVPTASVATDAIGNATISYTVPTPSCTTPCAVTITGTMPGVSSTAVFVENLQDPASAQSAHLLREVAH